ncbi:hypothetical protein ACUNWD_11985 [Sunxiuqinia sp. A32]|uniref:hypothetical protein n=1 Tax=Sunxiuqinia sp. A32 TaxID=3461496 RepID=UPI004046179D
MELKDLKSAWNKYSSSDANRHQLGEKAIYDMLRKRTKNLIERIDRNIKIGYGVLIALTLFFLIDDLFLTPYLAQNKDFEIPTWIYLTDAINALFIFGTFIYFNLQYYSVKKNYSQSNNLQNVLEGIVRILHSYQKLFYLAIVVLLLVSGVSFVTGMFNGYEMAAQQQGGNLNDLSDSQVRNTLLIGILILIAFTSVLFLIFRWGFRKLYGNYILKLETTLQELNEIE